MVYDEFIAHQVAQTHLIHSKAIRVWKSRGIIPNKYFNADLTVKSYVEQVLITDSDKHRLLAIFALNQINFSEIKAISLQKLSDCKRNKGVITKQEYMALKKEIVNLKNKAQPIFEAKAYTTKIRVVKQFFTDPRIKPFTFISSVKAKHRENYAIKLLTSNFANDPELEVLEQIVINIALFVQSLIL